MSIDTSRLNDPVYSEFSDDEDFAELIELFASSMPEKISVMRQAFSSNNILELRTYAHQLKGSGAGYGFSQLSKIASELEEACKTQDLLIITEKLENVINYLARVTC